MTDCPGHFGNIKLALPVFHIGYFKHTVSILQVVCKECSRVLLSQEDYAKMLNRVRTNSEPSTNLRVLKATIDECKKMKTCIYCGAFNGSVKKKPNEALKILHDKFRVTKETDIEELVHQFEHSCTINTEVEKSLKDAIEELDPMKVYLIFSKIREEDILLFHMDSNLCRPIDLLIFQLPAPPLCIRPSVAVTQTVKNEDDLTVKLSEIAFFNKEI